MAAELRIPEPKPFAVFLPAVLGVVAGTGAAFVSSWIWGAFTLEPSMPFGKTTVTLPLTRLLSWTMAVGGGMGMAGGAAVAMSGRWATRLSLALLLGIPCTAAALALRPLLTGETAAGFSTHGPELGLALFIAPPFSLALAVGYSARIDRWKISFGRGLPYFLGSGTLLGLVLLSATPVVGQTFPIGWIAGFGFGLAQWVGSELVCAVDRIHHERLQG